MPPRRLRPSTKRQRSRKPPEQRSPNPRWRRRPLPNRAPRRERPTNRSPRLPPATSRSRARPPVLEDDTPAPIAAIEPAIPLQPAEAVDVDGVVERFRHALGLKALPAMFRADVEGQTAACASIEEPGPRLVAAAILAAHARRGDEPVGAYRSAYDDLLNTLAPGACELIWPSQNDRLSNDTEVATATRGRSEIVRALVRPGLVGPAPERKVLVRPRVIPA